jgi:hypothetical protein
LVNGKFHKLGGDEVICTCVPSMKAHEILEQFHNGPIGGHFGPLITILKKLVAR